MEGRRFLHHRIYPVLDSLRMHLTRDYGNSESRIKDPLGLIHFDIPSLAKIQTQFGKSSVQHIMQLIESRLATLRSLAGCAIISHETISNSTFILVKFPLGHGRLSTLLYDATTSLSSTLSGDFERAVPQLSNLIELRFGTGVIRPETDRPFRDIYYDALVDAIVQSNQHNDPIRRGRQAELRDIIQNQRIESVYQPIVSLWTGEAYGYEALSRGPIGSVFATPLRLFDFAEQVGQLHALEEVALEKAMTYFQPEVPNLKLFLNINASMFTEEDFVLDRLRFVLEGRGLEPHNIVLEISERRSIEDFDQFNQILNQYRNAGYLIAIDDAGAGYSSLQSIVSIKPDFIKIDRSLIQNIHEDKLRQKLVEALCQAAMACECKVIAEGIETSEELTQVLHLGVPYAQGYLLGRPAQNLQPVSGLLREALRVSTSNARPQSTFTTVGDIAKPVTTFTADVEAREIVTYFHQNEHVTGIVITENNRPIGLVMREKLFRRLATKYGVSLFWNRPISQVMDRHPLILDKSVSLENSSVLSMGRSAEQLYDLIIVTNEGRLHGGLTVQMILNSLTNLQMELARDANPLTGLPGNRRITIELSKRLSEAKAFSVIYADLDHFKWFNDAFGFQKGDHAIRALSEALRKSVAMLPEADRFIGHIGGDDFIVITTSENAYDLAKTIRSTFHTEFENAFPMPENGSWTVRDREGNVMEVDGLTISLSVLRCDPPFSEISQESIAACAGVLKREAKRESQSSIVFGVYADMVSSQSV